MRFIDLMMKSKKWQICKWKQ